MAAKPGIELTAIESAKECDAAYRRCRDHFKARAQWARPTVLWDEATGVAATFWHGKRGDRQVFWIAFAHTPITVSQKLLVEVNPPRSGISERFQGG